MDDMAQGKPSFQCNALVQQGYDYTPRQLDELAWGLRFTPLVCMAGAIVGLITRQPAIHFTLAVLGIAPFWFPAWNPIDRLYNHVLRPLWKGVRLPSNPLPRRIACLMGGAMNVGIGIAFVQGNVPVAYGLGAVLLVLQLVVITTHFCVASWMYEGLLRILHLWSAPVSIDRARSLLESGGLLLDVRSPDEFAHGHLPGARNAPLDDLSQCIEEPRIRCLLLYCQSGLRSQRATQVLKKKGYANVHNLGAMARFEQGGGLEA